MKLSEHIAQPEKYFGSLHAQVNHPNICNSTRTSFVLFHCLFFVSNQRIVLVSTNSDLQDSTIALIRMVIVPVVDNRGTLLFQSKVGTQRTRFV